MIYNDENVDAYLKDLKRIPLLTPEEEKELAKKAAEGSKSAKKRLISANSSLRLRKLIKGAVLT